MNVSRYDLSSSLKDEDWTHFVASLLLPRVRCLAKSNSAICHLRSRRRSLPLLEVVLDRSHVRGLRCRGDLGAALVLALGVDLRGDRVALPDPRIDDLPGVLRDFLHRLTGREAGAQGRVEVTGSLGALLALVVDRADVTVGD